MCCLTNVIIACNSNKKVPAPAPYKVLSLHKTKKGCRWEGGIEMCIIAPVYSMEDCRLQLIPATARLNLLSFRTSNCFQTWPCRYNYVHPIQCDQTHNLIHLLASQYYKSARYKELASCNFELVSRYYELVSRYYELASRYYEFASRYIELASRNYVLFSC